MTDREMLELAAKAIGGSYWHDARTFSDYLMIEQDEPVKWNPANDDGDALRLAVRLEIEIRVFNGRAHAGKQGGFWCSEGWFPDQDPYAATRRAIVRAAAEIGKAMP